MNAAERRAYQKVTERSEGVCEACGAAEAIQMHHRKYRSRGGVTSPENLLHVCLTDHRNAETVQGHEDGWSVHRWGNPAHVPVLYRGVKKWLTRDGRAEDVGADFPL